MGLVPLLMSRGVLKSRMSLNCKSHLGQVRVNMRLKVTFSLDYLRYELHEYKREAVLILGVSAKEKSIHKPAINLKIKIIFTYDSRVHVFSFTYRY